MATPAVPKASICHPFLFLHKLHCNPNLFSSLIILLFEHECWISDSRFEGQKVRRTLTPDLPTPFSDHMLCRHALRWPCHFNFWTHRVRSANFSRRKIGHAHDNSADSENVAGACEPNVHAHFIFRFENGQGNQSRFLSMTKIQLKRVNHKLSRRTIDVPSTGRAREASSGPKKSLVQHGLVEKRQTLWVEESLC